MPPLCRLNLRSGPPNPSNEAHLFLAGRVRRHHNDLPFPRAGRALTEYSHGASTTSVPGPRVAASSTGPTFINSAVCLQRHHGELMTLPTLTCNAPADDTRN